jgi:hypothetical protein
MNMKNYEEKQENLDGKTPIETFNRLLENPLNRVFILYYMEGCGPCNAVRPEWEKLKNTMKTIEKREDIAIVDVDQVLSNKLKNMKEPEHFPTMRFVTDQGNVSENYEDSDIQTKDRTIDSFVEWIHSKTNNMKGGKRKYMSTKNQSQKKRKNQTKRKKKGGKWSWKYKHSIHCKRPKGFSQKQYCKYSFRSRHHGK